MSYQRINCWWLPDVQQALDARGNGVAKHVLTRVTKCCSDARREGKAGLLTAERLGRRAAVA